MNKPICPNCNKLLSPAGGILNTDITFWKCWVCGYELEDAVYIEMNRIDTIQEKIKQRQKQPKLTKLIKWIFNAKK